MKQRVKSYRIDQLLNFYWLVREGVAIYNTLLSFLGKDFDDKNKVGLNDEIIKKWTDKRDRGIIVLNQLIKLRDTKDKYQRITLRDNLNKKFKGYSPQEYITGAKIERQKFYIWYQGQKFMISIENEWEKWLRRKRQS